MEPQSALITGTYVLIESIAFLLSVSGNLLVCYAVISNKKRQRLSNKYIFSVAFADLLVGAFAIPAAILKVLTDSPSDFTQCLCLTSFAIFVYGASLSSLSAVSFDRFWAICYPISYRNRNNPSVTRKIIWCWWMFPFLIGILPVLGWNGEKSYMRDNKCSLSYVLHFNYIFLCCFFACLGCLGMILLYFLIYCKLVRQVKKQSCRAIGSFSSGSSRRSQMFPEPDPEDLNRPKTTEVRMAHTFALIIGSYILFWTPVTVNFLIVALTENGKFFQSHWILQLYFNLSVCAAHFNSALNPFIYAYRIKDVREAANESCRKLKSALCPCFNANID